MVSLSFSRIFQSIFSNTIAFFPEKGIYNLIVNVLILPFQVKGQLTYYTMGTNKYHTSRVDRPLHRKMREQHEC